MGLVVHLVLVLICAAPVLLALVFLEDRGIVPLAVTMTASAAVFIGIPPAVAVWFGHRLGRDESLSPGDAALVGVGAAGLLVILSTVRGIWRLHHGAEPEDWWGTAASVVAAAFYMAGMAGVTAFGAWWAGRSRTAGRSDD